jgi:hypothetical protein
MTGADAGQGQPRQKLRLDLGDTDWDHIADRLRASWRQIAPKKLLGLMDIADQF